MQRLREKTGAFARKYPCIVSFLAVLAAFAGYLADSSLSYPVLVIPFGVAVAAALFLLSRKDFLLRFLIPGFLGLVSLFLHLRELRGDPLRQMYHTFPVRAEVRGIAEDSSLAPGISFAGNTKACLFRITSVKDPEGVWRTCSAKVMAYLPPEFSVLAGYGDEFQVSGLLRTPSRPAVPQAFDYREYLRGKQILYLLNAEEAVFLRSGSGLTRGLLDFRDALLEKLCGRMSPEKVRNLAPGILFGVRHIIDPQTKQEFLESGLIHILSVSGTHVMLFAGLMLLVFSFLPLRPRYGLAILFTFLYTLSTGMQEPAFRAFFMFALFLGLRAFQLRSLALNTLALAALILSLRNPDTLLSTGFQFSFLTVAALILCTQSAKHWFFLPGEGIQLVPSTRYTKPMIRSEVRRKRIVITCFTCLATFLVSLPLSLLYQGILPAGSIFANLLILPLNSIIFAVFTAACLLSFLPGAVSCFAVILSCLFGCLKETAALFASYGQSIPKPQIGLVILYLLLTFFLLTARRLRHVVLSSVLLTILTFHLFMAQDKRQDAVVLLTDGNKYSICLLQSSGSSAVCLALADIGDARELQSVFASEGIRTCILSLNLSDSRDSLLAQEYLKEKMPVLNDFRIYRMQGRAFRECRTADCTARSWDDRFFFRYHLDSGKVIYGMLRSEESGGFRWTLKENDELLEEIRIPPSSRSRLCMTRLEAK